MNEEPEVRYLPEGIQKELQEAENAAGNILYVTDSGEIYRRLREAGFPVVGWIHESIRGDCFPGAPYLVEEPQEIDPDSWTKIWQRLTGRPWTIAVTERLWIREHSLEDLAALYRLYEDPEARRFLEPLQEDRAAEKQILQAYIEKVYGLYGYGMWAVCDRESGELIGRVGFAPYGGHGQEPELGYLIRADLRGRGLAQEAVTAALRFAKEELGFTRVCARTDADNASSIALLRRLGFEVCKTSPDGLVLQIDIAAAAASRDLTEKSPARISQSGAASDEAASVEVCKTSPDGLVLQIDI